MKNESGYKLEIECGFNSITLTYISFKINVWQLVKKNKK